MQKYILRILAVMIDVLIIFIPGSLLLEIFNNGNGLNNFLVQLLFAVYNTVALSSFEGRTVGKYFAKLRVVSEQSGALYLGLREVFKLLYFIPVVNLILLAVDVLLALGKKKLLHDYLGMSEVLTEKAYQKKYRKKDVYESGLVR